MSQINWIDGVTLVNGITLGVAKGRIGWHVDCTQLFDSPFLLPNATNLEQAKFYALQMVWEKLKELIEKKKLYPVTILKSLDVCEKNSLVQANFLLIEDLLDHGLLELKKKTKLKKKVLEKAIDETEHILG